jgi:hypothetical protein
MRGRQGKDREEKEHGRDTGRQRHTLIDSGTPMPVEKCMVRPNKPSVTRADNPTIATHMTCNAFTHLYYVVKRKFHCTNCVRRI